MSRKSSLQNQCVGLVRNPADLREVVGFAPGSDKAAVEKAIDDALDGALVWQETALKRRRTNLKRIADALAANAEYLARSLTMEVGKPIVESKAEVAGTIDVFNHYASLPVKERVVTRSEGSAMTFFEREPYGICALILPWNYPLALLSWKAAPALLAGNSIIIKPSEHAPLTVADAARIFTEILPTGVIHAVIGGDSVGEQLVSSTKVARVSITGSPSTGLKVMAATTNRPTKVTLELGGNDPLIIMGDVNLGRCFESIFWSSLRNCGQVCVAAKRIYVHSSLYRKAIGMYTERVRGLRIGNGLDTRTELGPVNNPEQLSTVERLVQSTIEWGGRLEAGGRRLGGENKHGLFYEPAIVSGLDNGAPLVREEQFGPAIPLIAFSDETEAIHMANDSDLALGATVWSADKERALRVARELEAGVVWVNGPLAVDISAPFGGFKGSGTGRELGIPGYEECTAPKTYVVR